MIDATALVNEAKKAVEPAPELIACLRRAGAGYSEHSVYEQGARSLERLSALVRQFAALSAER